MHHGAKQSKDEHADTEYQQIRPEVARRNRANCRSSAVPTKRCKETVNAAPSDDCAITTVVIGAQYVSGSRNKRDTSTETTAATAVRAECTKTGNQVRSTPFLAIPLTVATTSGEPPGLDYLVNSSAPF